MIRVLVVDDQALVRGGFRMILDAQKDIEVVGEAEDAITCVRELPEVPLIVMPTAVPTPKGVSIPVLEHVED